MSLFVFPFISLALIFFLLVNSSNASEVTIGGEIEIIFSHQSIKKETADYERSMTHFSGENVLFVLSQSQVNDWSIEGKISALFEIEDESMRSEDIYLSFSKNAWTTTLGYFEAGDLYSLGMDVLVNTADKDIFEVAEAKGRESGAIMLEYFHNESTYQINLISANDTASDGTDEYDLNKWALRPAYFFENERINFAFGVELIEVRAQEKDVLYERSQENFGGFIEYTFGGTTVGLSVGFQEITGKDFSGSINGEISQKSQGIYLNQSFSNTHTVGLGFHQNEYKEGAVTETMATEATVKDIIWFLAFEHNISNNTALYIAGSRGQAKTSLEPSSDHIIDRNTSFSIQLEHEF